MAYVELGEELDEQVQKQIREFKKRLGYSGNFGWFRVRAALDRARNHTIYHDRVENYVLPNLFDDNGDAIYWITKSDPEASQVSMVKKHLKRSSYYKRKRGRVTPLRLKMIMREILLRRLEIYENQENMEKLKILCIVGSSGSGKTLASLHLKNYLDANVICSFTTRPPRETEVEGREHHFIDIVPDRSDMLAYAHFGRYYYYALKTQVYGPCTVYVIDEKGLQNLRDDCGDQYEIYTMLIKRDDELKRKVGVDASRIRRDKGRDLVDSDYDYVVENNGSKKEFFRQIEQIYNEVKNK